MREVEIIKDVYSAFSRGDIPRVLESFSPEIEWVTPPTLPWSTGHYRGHDGIQQYFHSFLEALEQPQIDVQELVEQDGRVIALGFERATVRKTGAGFAARFAHVWTVANNKVVRMEGIIDSATVCRAFA